MKKQTPKKLGKAGRRFWLETLKEYELTDTWQWRLLEQAAICLDDIETFTEQIKKDGACVPNRYGTPTPHPLIKMVRAAQQTYIKCIRELGLSLQTEETKRGNMLYGYKA